jgi:hypothetical protein
MNLDGLASGIQQIWEEKPGACILMGLGIVVFVFLVGDTWRHRRRRKKSRPLY